MRATASKTEKGVVVHLAPPAAHASVELDVIFCVDASHSMGSPARGKDGAPVDDEGHEFTLLDVAKHSIQTAVGMLPAQSRVAVCSFADTVLWDASFTACDAAGKAAVVDAAMKIQPRGFTNLFAGLRDSYAYATQARRPSAACRIILLNDGQPSAQYHPPRDGAPDELLTECYVRHLAPWTSRASLTTLTCVGLGYHLDSRLMADLGVFLHVPTFADVGAFLVNLTAWMCSMVVLPDGTPASNVHLVVSAGGATTTLALEQLVRDRTVHAFLECPADEVCVQLFVADKTMVLNELVAVTEGQRELCTKEVARCRVAALLAEAARADQWQAARAAVRRAVDVATSVRGTALSETLVTEVSLAVETERTWRTWGQHYLRTFPQMLLACRRSNFRDKALQEFAMTDEGTPGRFEAFAQEGEALFATLTIAPSYRTTGRGGGAATARTVPDHFFRGGGCIHEDVLLQVSDKCNGVVVKRTSAIRKGDWIQVPHGFARVRMVAQTCCPTNHVEMVSLGGKVNPLLITPWHPVCYKGTWQFPCDVVRAEVHKSAFVYSFVLEDACSFVANGIECVALGHGLPAPHVAHHPYWGDAVVGLMETVLASHPDEGGVVDMTRICHEEQCVLPQ